MIIINIKGGLGNQLFQYAMGEHLKEKGIEVKYDISYFDRYFRNYALDYFIENIEILDINILKQNKLPYFYFRYRNKKGLQKVMRYFFTHFIRYIIAEPCAAQENRRINNIKGNHYLNGYWQNYKYFDTIKSVLQKNINLKKEYFNTEYIFWHEKIKKATNSVSIHVRRGDYLKKDNKFSVLNIDYYTKALKKIAEKTNEFNLFVFSDNIEWCKENLQINDAYYVEGHMLKDYHDFELIKNCKHHIIANSTFSWWAAYLNNNNKIVVAPKIWFDGKKAMREQARGKGIQMPDEWITV